METFTACAHMEARILVAPFSRSRPPVHARYSNISTHPLQEAHLKETWCKAATVLYGMTSEGGNYGAGTLFRITTNGAFTVLRHFNYDTDGGSPNGTLIIQKPDPVVHTQTVSTPKNILKKIKLTATGGGTPLIYAIATAPKNGTAVVIKDTLTYTPKTNFVGADSVYVTATWGCQKSVPAKVQVEVD